ncbi:MAG: C40 family peptidase [Treponema sp.]|nr:C40 family peptidase [Treponema sp.]
MTSLQITANTLRNAGVSTPCIYRHLLKEFNGTPYKWGGSSLGGSDCSGSVCAALSAATGCSIRVCADELYRTVFTQPYTYSADRKEPISAAFFLDEKGKAVHVAGYCGVDAITSCTAGTFMNVSSCEKSGTGTFRTLKELEYLYPHLHIELKVLREDFGHGHIQDVF